MSDENCTQLGCWRSFPFLWCRYGKWFWMKSPWFWIPNPVGKVYVRKRSKKFPKVAKTSLLGTSLLYSSIISSNLSMFQNRRMAPPISGSLFLRSKGHQKKKTCNTSYHGQFWIPCIGSVLAGLIMLSTSHFIRRRFSCTALQLVSPVISAISALWSNLSIVG